MLEAFFLPVHKSITKGFAKQKGLLGSELKIYSGKFPNPAKVDVAIIGLGKNADLVRRQLYGYSYHFTGIEIADFGNLNHNGTPKNVNAGLSECIIALKAENIIPVFIGDDENYSDGLFKSNTFSQVDYALVSPLIQFQATDLAKKLQAKRKLFHMSFIGYQNFLNTRDTVQESSAEIFSEHIRLGSLRADMAKVEPLLRQADIFEFDLSAIRHADFNSGMQTLPNGLFNYEACAVCRYAGVSNTIGIYLLNHFDLDKGPVTDHMQVAQMLWYILDGIDNRFNDHPVLNHRNFTVYKCHANSGEDMVFMTSALTGRWWMQVPNLDKSKKTAPKFIGCNEEDFEIAKQGEVPEKWYRAVGLA
jgi:formiminoglutamase